MTIYHPYFYIIQDIRNGIYYAGVKWGKDSDPNKFLVEGGYTTSSVTVNKIIDLYGISTFIVRRIKTFKTAEEACKYETLFLNRINAKINPRFYNKHNNDHLFSYYDEKYTEKMLEKYGVISPLKSPEIYKKLIFTNINRYRAPNVFSKESSLREKINHSFLCKYGVSNISQLKSTQDKIRATSIEKRGIEHHLKDPSVIQKRLSKISQFSEEQMKVIKKKSKNTKKSRYNNENYNNIQKIQETNLLKYGVKNVSQIDEIRQKKSVSISKTKNSEEWKLTNGLLAKERLSRTINDPIWKETIGKEKSEKISKSAKNREKKMCQHCFKLLDPSNYKRWHGDNCKKR